MGAMGWEKLGSAASLRRNLNTEQVGWKSGVQIFVYQLVLMKSDRRYRSNQRKGEGKRPLSTSLKLYYKTRIETRITLIKSPDYNPNVV